MFPVHLQSGGMIDPLLGYGNDSSQALSSDSPRMAQARKTTEMAKVEQNLKANAWADPGSYANKLGPAPALFQYG